MSLPPPPPPPPATAPGSDPAKLGFEHCFRVYIGNSSQFVGTFLSVSGLAVEREVFEYVEGGNNYYAHHLQGRLKWPNLKLTSGLTNQSVLLQWVLGQGSLTGPQNLQIIFTTVQGNVLRRFGFAGAVPVRWTGPTADIGASKVATEELEVAHNGLTQPL